MYPLCVSNYMRFLVLTQSRSLRYWGKSLSDEGQENTSHREKGCDYSHGEFASLHSYYSLDQGKFSHQCHLPRFQTKKNHRASGEFGRTHSHTSYTWIYFLIKAGVVCNMCFFFHMVQMWAYCILYLELHGHSIVKIHDTFYRQCFLASSVYQNGLEGKVRVLLQVKILAFGGGVYYRVYYVIFNVVSDCYMRWQVIF